jgi:hypothetical protein
VGGRADAVYPPRGVSNHAIGERDLDLSAWVGRFWAVPTQNRRSLRLFEPGDGVPHPHDVALPRPAAHLLRWRRQAQDGIALQLRDGSVHWLPVGP